MAEITQQPDAAPATVLATNGICNFYKEFTNENVAPVIEWILAENLRLEKHRKKNLTIIINSNGGTTHSCFALIDVIRGSKIPIDTIGLGMIASSALMLFMVGKKRSITQNTTILSHQFSGWSGGKYHELLSTTKQHDLVNTSIMRHYKSCTGMSKKNIDKYLLPSSDVWLTAEEAVKYGIADTIALPY